ncbi:Putative N-acetyl-LL-diaminopimelate aminotransferase [Rhodococcoides fascians]|nr:Putative N-acetyl-LL-diaminopimelate aminotransferase [Rhodococcus fascians]
MRSGAVRLDIGDPPFRLPDVLTEALTAAVRDDSTHYVSGYGTLAFRTAAAEKLSRVNGLDTNPESIVATHGATQGIFAALSVLTRPGDRILLPNPAWPNYRTMAKSLDLDIIYYDTYRPNDRGWEHRLEAILQRRPRVTIWNNPSNPTGVSTPTNKITDVESLISSLSDYVVADDCYDELSPSPQRQLHASNLVRCFSLSKTHAMTGLRLGYLTAAPDISRLVAAYQESTLACVNSSVQAMGCVALGQDWAHIDQFSHHYRSSQAAAEAVVDLYPGITVEGSGAMFSWVHVPDTTVGTVKGCLRLLDETNVALVPGSSFGTGHEEYFRVAHSAPLDSVPEAMHTVCKYLTQLREDPSQT